jgi:hypothetical protein
MGVVQQVLDCLIWFCTLFQECDQAWWTMTSLVSGKSPYAWDLSTSCFPNHKLTHRIFSFQTIGIQCCFSSLLHMDLNWNSEEYLYNISLSESWNDSTYSMTSWLRFPIPGSKGPCRFRSMSSLQDPHIFQPIGPCTFLSINSSYFLKNTTPRELHICWYRRSVWNPSPAWRTG